MRGKMRKLTTTIFAVGLALVVPTSAFAFSNCDVWTAQVRLLKATCGAPEHCRLARDQAAALPMFCSTEMSKARYVGPILKELRPFLPPPSQVKPTAPIMPR